MSRQVTKTFRHGKQMRADYWIVTDEEVIEKTGKELSHWTGVLDSLGAADKKSNDVVAYLQTQGVPRYWARTLVTRYQKGFRD